MSVFMPTSVIPPLSPPDTSKHVNYVLGMVLGVDDFNQEFAYLSGRDQLAARELGGYGVVRGLHVTTQIASAEKGPEVVVSAGVAVTPEGRFVHVPRAQCAILNEWINIEGHKAALKPRLDVTPTESVAATATLHVVLAYDTCETDLVPIPGEPCRTEEESMAESRVADDFRLELCLDPPERRQDDAARAYLAWLASVPVVDGGGTPLDVFLASIVASARASQSPAILGNPAPSLEIPRGEAASYLREAIHLYPTLRAVWLGAGATEDGKPPDDARLLLASVNVRIVLAGLGSSVWVVESAQPDKPQPVVVDAKRRPSLVPRAFLQEAMLVLAEGASKRAVELAGVGPTYLVAAAGIVEITEKEGDPVAKPWPSNGLVAWASGPGEVTVKFAGPKGPGLQYIVKAMPIAKGPAFMDPSVSSATFVAVPPLMAGQAPCFKLTVKNAGNPVPQVALKGQKLMLEISALRNGQ